VGLDPHSFKQACAPLQLPPNIGKDGRAAGGPPPPLPRGLLGTPQQLKADAGGRACWLCPHPAERPR